MKVRPIFLETSNVVAELAGHLYLVYRECGIDDEGNIINLVTVDDLVIRGGPANSTGNFADLRIWAERLGDTLDGYGLPGNEPPTRDPEATPEDRRSLDITSQILGGGIYGDVESAWEGMSAFAENLNEQYRYELPDIFAAEHVSNSNATVLTVLNNAGVDVRNI